ncbi:MAG: tRNA threonylcarbamoyladenosine dehydratase [Lachnospiraceae bacterium]
MNKEQHDNTEDAFLRTQQLLGEDGMHNLKKARVAVFGIGGVGGYAVEALTRSGVGHLALIDPDRVAYSNLNRQIIATRDTIGQYKTDVMQKRILSINPDAEVSVSHCFYLPDRSAEFDFTRYDYVIDAVDTVTAKIELVLQAQSVGTPIISSMGAGNKLDPTALEIADIYQTSVCPLAKVMRRELRSRGVTALRVVYSREQMHKRSQGMLGSVAFVPSVAGLMIAGEVIKEIAKIRDDKSENRSSCEK